MQESTLALPLAISETQAPMQCRHTDHKMRQNFCFEARDIENDCRHAKACRGVASSVSRRFNINRLCFLDKANTGMATTFCTAGCILLDTNFSTAFSAASSLLPSSLESASTESLLFFPPLLAALYRALRASMASCASLTLQAKLSVKRCRSLLRSSAQEQSTD